MNIARSYASRLFPLSNEVKRDIVKLLIDSITAAGTQPSESAEERFDRLYGCWANDSEMENIGTELRNSRTSGTTRKI